MKRLFFILFFLFSFTITAYSGELYACLDHGKTIVTSAPQDGMTNCVLKDAYDDPPPIEKRIARKRTVVLDDEEVEKAKKKKEQEDQDKLDRKNREYQRLTECQDRCGNDYSSCSDDCSKYYTGKNRSDCSRSCSESQRRCRLNNGCGS